MHKLVSPVFSRCSISAFRCCCSTCNSSFDPPWVRAATRVSWIRELSFVCPAKYIQWAFKTANYPPGLPLKWLWHSSSQVGIQFEIPSCRPASPLHPGEGWGWVGGRGIIIPFSHHCAVVLVETSKDPYPEELVQCCRIVFFFREQ